MSVETWSAFAVHLLYAGVSAPSDECTQVILQWTKEAPSCTTEFPGAEPLPAVQVWWAATLGIVLALSRAFIVDSTAAFQPEAAMLEVPPPTRRVHQHSGNSDGHCSRPLGGQGALS